MKAKTELIFSIVFFFIVFVLQAGCGRTGEPVRHTFTLDQNWHTVASDSDKHAYDGFEKAAFSANRWKVVDVPHNWDDYGGYRRMIDGHRHGYAWYRKTFTVDPQNSSQHYFLWFEGVSSYATVWLNGQKVGTHAGGRTSFTLDITDAIRPGQSNLLAVRADHPRFIHDLPWVCGAASNERGFSEGSEPMGIFRPVHLVVTNDVRIEPFGVHIWNDTTISRESATLNIETEVKDYGEGGQARNITVVSRLVDEEGQVVAEATSDTTVKPGVKTLIPQEFEAIKKPHLWSLEDPYLYSVQSQILEEDRLIDQTRTPYGIRWISWPIGRKGDNKQFLLNGKPVYINGVAEYEHLLGQSHAFTKEQVRARVGQAEAAGFNAFRDAHQPHNLRYQQAFERDGLLWWPQFTAHVWFDTPAFRKNFKNLLRDWIRERRNNPAAILWGLENESTLPADFARECTNIIRQMDPTASSQRKVVTCNGGAGTDWDVPQNWTGTYGGDPATYARDVQEEVLVGEYGAWRRTDLHTEGPFDQDGMLSENRMSRLMEMKVRLAESVRNKFSGQFMWLLASHDNPGRIQSGEGYRDIDRIGPVNYKGLFTIWGEPVDAFYMYRANYTSAHKHPMAYIVSHRWPDRWTEPGLKDSIAVYSNCDSVALYNDVNAHSLGVRIRKGIGTHFRWNQAEIRYNVLYAVGYVGGRAVAKDYVVLNHLPEAPHFSELIDDDQNITRPKSGYQYVYRVNAGGPGYTDKNGNRWMADHHRAGAGTWGSLSWTDDYDGLPPFYGSQRRTFDPIRGTSDWSLFQTFRYGRHRLRYVFPVPDGDYRVELYFTEPWYGTGGGMDCTGWRLFDVAVNDSTVIHNLDIWKEAGSDGALKKTVNVHLSGGRLKLSFPKVESGQAVISAIAIASGKDHIRPAPRSESLVRGLKVSQNAKPGQWNIVSWLDTGDRQYRDTEATFSQLPPAIYAAEWLKTPESINTEKGDLARFRVGVKADVYIGISSDIPGKPAWMKDFQVTNEDIKNDRGDTFRVYRKIVDKDEYVILGPNGKHAPMYVVAVNKHVDMTPPYDLKPSRGYDVEEAKLIGEGLNVHMLNEKRCITFTDVTENTVRWSVHVGIADEYALHVKYANPTDRPLEAEMEVKSAGGSVLTTKSLKFLPTKPGKWNILTTTTGSSINAGDYSVSITSRSAKDLSISKLSVQ